MKLRPKRQSRAAMLRMEQIESAVDRVQERWAAAIECRLLRTEELLPWSTAELGWAQEQLRPETVFVAEKGGTVCGLVIAAEVHGTLLLVRMLGFGGAWVRPLFRFIRLVCFQRQIAGVWMVAENRNQSESKLLKLLPRFVDESGSQEQTTILFGGRFNHAGSSSNSVAGAIDYGDRSGGRDRHHGVQPGDRTGFAVDQLDLEHGCGGAKGGARSAAESGGPGTEPEHPNADRGKPDADELSVDLGQERWRSVRSQLAAAVFGGR
jgi:hypothetical protein